MSELGRPTKYKDEYNEQARKLCLLGATDKDLADFFQVNEDTINEWKKGHPIFSESIKSGKELADIKVVEALFKRAIGYSYKEIHSKALGKESLAEDAADEDFIIDEGNGFSEIKVVTKEVVPDPVAIIFWLKNRQPKKWRDKQEVETTIVDNRIKVGYGKPEGD